MLLDPQAHCCFRILNRKGGVTNKPPVEKAGFNGKKASVGKHHQLWGVELFGIPSIPLRNEGREPHFVSLGEGGWGRQSRMHPSTGTDRVIGLPC